MTRGDGARGCRAAMLRKELGPGTWPGPGGLEMPPPSWLTWWHKLTQAHEAPLLFFFSVFFLPVLFSVEC